MRPPCTGLVTGPCPVLWPARPGFFTTAAFLYYRGEGKRLVAAPALSCDRPRPGPVPGPAWLPYCGSEAQSWSPNWGACATAISSSLGVGLSTTLWWNRQGRVRRLCVGKYCSLLGGLKMVYVALSCGRGRHLDRTPFVMSRPHLSPPWQGSLWQGSL